MTPPTEPVLLPWERCAINSFDDLRDALTDLLDLVGDPDPDAYADGISYGHAVEVVERAKAALAKAGGE